MKYGNVYINTRVTNKILVFLIQSNKVKFHQPNMLRFTNLENILRLEADIVGLDNRTPVLLRQGEVMYPGKAFLPASGYEPC